MKLRDFRKEDAPIIAGWIRSEEELYKWSADRINRYPLTGDFLLEKYKEFVEAGCFYPLTAVNEEGRVIGHFFIRRLEGREDCSVRFGFVILNPEQRGKGFGKEMIREGIRYAVDHFSASRVELGVFENNESARHCYEAVGFRAYKQRECEMSIGTWNCIDMELFTGKEAAGQ
ncbi:MAG: GNAT family N-acetyltransferase [Clostridia bacterium]|nr:GNAT family N-acetyltransferase [Clostridia bacterium]